MSRSEDLLERSEGFPSGHEPICSAYADHGCYCMLSHGESLIDMAFSPGERGQFIKYLITSPSSTTLSRRCYDGDKDSPQYCELSVNNSEFHNGHLVITLTKDQIPSKSTVAIWIASFFISGFVVVYVYRRVQKRKLQGTMVTFSAPNPRASMPTSHMDAQQTKSGGTDLKPITWARKNCSTASELGGYY